MNRSRSRIVRAGFTLVETTIAMGVAVFCLMSICGLLSVGIQSSRVSMEQTTATNTLTSIISDLHVAPNPTPGSTQISPVYGIVIPGATSGVAAATASAPVYIGDDGLPTKIEKARYRLQTWTTPGVARKATLARLVLSWPATIAANGSAEGSVETIIALDRN